MNNKTKKAGHIKKKGFVVILQRWQWIKQLQCNKGSKHCRLSSVCSVKKGLNLSSYLANGTQHEPKRDSGPEPAIFKNTTCTLKVEHMGAVQLKQEPWVNQWVRQIRTCSPNGQTSTWRYWVLPGLQEQRRGPLWSRSYTCRPHPVSDSLCSYHNRADMGDTSPRSWLLRRGVHKDEFYCKLVLHTPVGDNTRDTAVSKISTWPCESTLFNVHLEWVLERRKGEDAAALSHLNPFSLYFKYQQV